jgi:hypothetical protein
MEQEPEAAKERRQEGAVGAFCPAAQAVRPNPKYPAFSLRRPPPPRRALPSAAAANVLKP